jgi:hypothetical protein
MALIGGVPLADLLCRKMNSLLPIAATAVVSGVIAFPLLPATWVMKRRNFNGAIYANSSLIVNRWRNT